MKIQIRSRLHQPSDSLLALIRGQLEALGPKLRIDEARVLIERRVEASPPFRVAAHLVTPGPDVAADAVDHTLRAALQKLVTQLQGSIGHRHLKRAQRLKSRQRRGNRAVSPEQN